MTGMTVAIFIKVGMPRMVGVPVVYGRVLESATYKKAPRLGAIPQHARCLSVALPAVQFR